MSALKMAVTVVVRSVASSGFSAVRNPNPVFKLGYLSPMLATTSTSIVHRRSFSFKNITNSMQYITDDDDLNINMDPKTYKMVEPREKPLCIVLPWIMAKQRNVHKYAKIYLEQGYDVLTLRVSPWEVMWPLTGSKNVAFQVLKFMEANPQFGPMIMHGFSVGGYMWGEVCTHAIKDPERYQPVMDRIKGQIWDSITDVYEIPIGVSTGVFPHNRFLQKTLENLIALHMKTFYKTATVYYHKASRQFHFTMVKAPALFMLSKSDMVGTVRINKSVHDSWVEMGIKTTWKCWDRSAHVGHFLEHTEDYITLMSNHLKGLNLLPYPEKMLARIPEDKREIVLKNLINN